MIKKEDMKTTKEICVNEVKYCNRATIEFSGSEEDYNKQWVQEQKVKQTFLDILREIEIKEEVYWECNGCGIMRRGNIGRCSCGVSLEPKSTKRKIVEGALNVIKDKIPEDWVKGAKE